MVDISSGDKKINITVSTSGNKASVNATSDTAMYYSNKSREWAISDKIVDNEDYSSKYYANVSKQNADKSTVNLENLTTNYNQYKNELENIKDSSVEEITTLNTSSLAEIETAKAGALTDIDTLHVNSVNDIANFKNTSLSDIETSKTNAITDIANQETLSVDNVNTAGSTQVNNVNTAGTNQVNLAKEQVTLATNQATIATTQAGIATAKTNEVVESGNAALSNISNVKTEAITDIENLRDTSISAITSTKTEALGAITTQETTSKNNIETKGAEQIALIQNEGATQVANVQSTGQTEYNKIIATGIDYKANIDLNNLSEVGEKHFLKQSDKSQISGWGMPSNKHINLTLGASNSKYTAPANGYFLVRIKSTGTQKLTYVNIANNNSHFSIRDANYHSSTSAAYTVSCVCPAKKGDIVIVAYDVATTIQSSGLLFIYAEGEV